MGIQSAVYDLWNYTLSLEMANQSIAETSADFNLIALQINNTDFVITINLIAIAAAVSAGMLIWFLVNRNLKGRKVSKVTLNFPFGAGSVEITANNQEKLIAHRIWTELVTRKAALPFDREDDVVIEIYNSWYSLFGVVRALIRDIPIEELHGNQRESVEHLTELAISVLNDGLRPHLTKWQAKFRAWYEVEPKEGLAPQDVQKKYPHYEELIEDIEQVNAQLIGFSKDLKRLVLESS